MARRPRTTPEQLGAARVRTRLEAALLDAASGQVHRLHGDRKQAAIGAMTGTVVEIGPGTGANFGYYAPGTRVIAIEPNPNLHAALRAAADRHGVDLEIRTLRGEDLDVDDDSVEGVVGTLVLCGVDDPAAVVREIRRILVPGGTYFFLEHVAAPAGTWTRRTQDLVCRPHRWMFNGCEVNRDTRSVIESAGFRAVECEVLDAGITSAYVRHHLVGTATK